MEWEELPALFPGLPGQDRWLALLREHARLVEAAEPGVRVTSVPAADRVRRHYAESLEMVRLVTGDGDAPGLAIDIGSGGGWPGLVMAAVLPATRVVLVEPLKKRARLLAEIASVLGLGNVEVRAERAEVAGRSDLRDAGDVVTARAVAELRVLVEYCAPLAKPGGVIALAKGSTVEAEVREAATALVELSCEFVEIRAMREEVNGRAGVVMLRKIGETAPRYPRRAGMAAKRPLQVREVEGNC